MISGCVGQRPTLAWLQHAIPRGVRGHAPPRNFENAYSRRGISLDFQAKSRAFRTDFYQVTGSKVMMNWTVDCFYCLLILS